MGSTHSLCEADSVLDTGIAAAIDDPTGRGAGGDPAAW